MRKGSKTYAPTIRRAAGIEKTNISAAVVAKQSYQSWLDRGRVDTDERSEAWLTVLLDLTLEVVKSTDPSVNEYFAMHWLCHMDWMSTPPKTAARKIIKEWHAIGAASVQATDTHEQETTS